VVTVSGPLDDVRVVELASIGAGPHAGMVLADLGADVVRVERPGAAGFGAPAADDPLLRGRRRVQLDLKTREGVGSVLDLVERADVLVEGLRPGVTERLGLGPAQCLARNGSLVYGRITGWGQEGPLAQRAGHDLNYVSLTGALHAIGRAGERPVPPLNLVGDFGGGSMLLVVGVLAGVLQARATGRGQVVDAAMVDGTSTLLQLVLGLRHQGAWSDERASNLLDGGAPFYDTYTCSDGRWMAVAALEPQFYAQLVSGLGLAGADLPDQLDRSGWPVLRARFAGVFATRSRDEWAAAFEGTDACVTPVLSFEEAPEHPHLAARGTLVDPGGVLQAAPAPRFSATPARLPQPASEVERVGAVIADWT
jgi:alpha-methylacyl-CoA racemase